MSRRVGLLGGTFDPIHIVHLFMGRLAAEELGLAKVIFMPAGVPPHKVRDSVTSAEHRLAMARRAVDAEPMFELSDLELGAGGASYTIETVRELERTLERGTELYLIMGSDSLLEFPSWKSWEDLLSLVTLAVFPRPGHDVDIAVLPYANRVVLLGTDGIGFDVCSSAIRARVRKGRSIRFLVPRAVEDYILKHGLYREGP